MKVYQLLEFLQNQNSEAHVEFRDSTFNRQCPCNSVTVTRRKSGSKKNESGEAEDTFTQIVQLSNSFPR